MNRFFSMDNGLFRALAKFVDCLWLSILFLVSCIPVFTIGAAMTALYYTVHKVLRKDRGYVTTEYWHGFKTNFKQSTVVWLIVLAIGLVLAGDIKILLPMNKAGNPLGKAYVVFGVMMIFELIWCTYLFPYMARFANTTKAVMKNAALMAVLDFPRTFLVILIMAAFGLVVLRMPIPLLMVAMFLLPALYTWALNFVLEQVFRKYMTEEEREAEDEGNGEFKN